LKSVTLESQKFIDFIRVLSIFKDLCNDIDITDGYIRQKTNNVLCTFEIDLSSYIKGLNLPITDLKKKLDLLKSFLGQEVTIESDDVYFTFSDKYSSLKFRKPHKEFITKTNKFIDKKSFNNSISMDEDNLLLNTKLSKLITDRMRIVAQGFSVDAVVVDFKDDKAAISMNTESKDQSANLVSDITTEKDECVFKTHIPATPFIVDHDDDIIFKVFENDNNRLLNQFSTTISDINITVYSRSQTISTKVEEKEEEEE
jgi:hypothetical protein